ncbi:sensor histidine kinase [Myxococcus stipitatus]|uniref:sensor histidine kinase n=1 Tax=Myxococcus stipitatus TaxID=83455 RepID=UPI0002E58732|nr:histidine kinase [Myxococcus stipitatus]
MKFWLLQGLGWLPYLLVQLLFRAEDPPRFPFEHLLFAASLTLLALSGSLVLRAVYQARSTRPGGELKWLALVVGLSLAVALVVDLGHHALLWALASLREFFVPLAEDQPLFARAPLLCITYVAWSLLYLALSRQERLARAELSQQQLAVSLREAELQSLLAQLSPHFLFNAINNIRALILRDAESAREMLGRFADLLRYQIDGNKAALVTVSDELAVVHAYLALMRLQLGKRLQYEERVNSASLGRMTPKLSLQLLVENAVKHGLSQTSSPGVLRLEVDAGDGHLRMVVSNSGRLGDTAAGTGLGLLNLKKRLALAHGNAARFSLLQEGEWVVARIHIEGTP